MFWTQDFHMEVCPFDEIGCKFRHEFQHAEIAHAEEVTVQEVQESSEKIADKSAGTENQNEEEDCPLCNEKFPCPWQCTLECS